MTYDLFKSVSPSLPPYNHHAHQALFSIANLPFVTLTTNVLLVMEVDGLVVSTNCIHLMQILMSVPPTMEDVNRCVITPLVDSTAAVGQATSWMGMDSTVVVSNN